MRRNFLGEYLVDVNVCNNNENYKDCCNDESDSGKNFVPGLRTRSGEEGFGRTAADSPGKALILARLKKNSHDEENCHNHQSNANHDFYSCFHCFFLRKYYQILIKSILGAITPYEQSRLKHFTINKIKNQ